LLELVPSEGGVEERSDEHAVGWLSVWNERGQVELARSRDRLLRQLAAGLATLLRARDPDDRSKPVGARS